MHLSRKPLVEKDTKIIVECLTTSGQILIGGLLQTL